MKAYTLLEEAIFYAKKRAKETGEMQLVYIPVIARLNELPHLVIESGEAIENRGDYSYFGSYSKNWEDGRYVGD